MAPAGTYFQGEALQKAIFDQGLRYGSMSIFHRYRDARGGGPVQFSLANMVKPGTRSEENTSELQSRGQLVCRLMPEKENLEGNKLNEGRAILRAEEQTAELQSEFERVC